jgi:site-specific recombinase XerD
VAFPPPGGALPVVRIVDGTDRWRAKVGASLAAQESENTRAACRSEAAKWHAWCEQIGLDPFAARRKHADVYAWTVVSANSTRARALAALSSLYRYLLGNEEMTDGERVPIS